MEEKIRFKLRPLYVISHIILFIIDLFLYVGFQNYFFWLAAVLMVVLPAISAAGMFYLCRNLRVELGISENRVARGEEVLLELRLRNPTWFISLHSRLNLCIANVFLENASTVEISMPVKAHGENVLKMPVRIVDLGKYTLTCDTLFVQDIFCMVVGRKTISLSGELFAVPEGSSEEQLDVTGFLGGAAEVEESKSKGSDFSEVSDIREYIPGDRQRDIHWKLSARQDELMVKERVNVAGSEMVILPGFAENPEQAMQILEYVYQLGQNCIKQRMPVCLLCWNSQEFRFEEYRCGFKEEISEAYCEMYEIGLTKRVNKDWEQLMRNCYPYTKSYLLVEIQEESGEMKVEMRENG